MEPEWVNTTLDWLTNDRIFALAVAALALSAVAMWTWESLSARSGQSQHGDERGGC